MGKIIRIGPQKGPQERFLATSADICIYGGAAGGGKTFGLLLEPIRHMNNKNYNAVIFRSNYTQVTSPGGLWDSSGKIYSLVKGAYPLKTPKLHWTFKSGATVNFAHLGSDSDCQNWQGSQIAMIGFDELTHFSKHQFFYMLSRNRTDSGVAPYVRATCNPDADSWVADFIKWWITPETGYPIPERSGVIRYMVRLNDEIIWGDSKEELAAQGYDALLFTRCATSNASHHFKSPLAMGRDAFKPKHASSVSISEVIDTGVNSNLYATAISPTIPDEVSAP